MDAANIMKPALARGAHLVKEAQARAQAIRKVVIAR